MLKQGRNVRHCALGVYTVNERVKVMLVTIDKLTTEMTDDEYQSFLSRWENRGYVNHADEDADGNPVDVNEYILTGMDILIGLTTGE